MRRPTYPPKRRAPWSEICRDEYANFLRQFDWQHFATFTAPPPASERLVRSFHQTVRRLERVAQGPVRTFWVVEQGGGGVPHVHALLAGTRRLSCQEIAERWDLGHCDVQIYDPAQGAAYYLTKSLADEDTPWDLSSKLSPRPMPDADGPVVVRREDEDVAAFLELFNR